MSTNVRRRGVGKARPLQMAKIVRAAEIEFSQKGFDGVSLQAIADRAGFSKRQVIYFFGTKKNLYQTIISKIFKDWATYDLYQQEGSPRQILSAYIEKILKSSKEKPHLSKIIINEMTRGATVAIPVFRDLKTETTITSLKKRFEEWKTEGQIRSFDPVQYVFLVWAAQHFYAAFEPEIAYIMGREKLSDEDWTNIIEQIKDMLLYILEK